MRVGDRVKLTKGNPLGKVGTIEFEVPMKGPVNVTEQPTGLENAPSIRHFQVKADDGTIFYGTEDSLERV